MGNIKLKDAFNLVANTTAVSLICILFYQTQLSILEQSKQDRLMFIEQEKLNREAIALQAKMLVEAINSNQRSIEKTLNHVSEIHVMIKEEFRRLWREEKQ